MSLHRKAHTQAALETWTTTLQKTHISWSGLLIHIFTTALSCAKKVSQEELLLVPRCSAVTLWAPALLWNQPILGAQQEESEVTKMRCPRRLLKKDQAVAKTQKMYPIK